MRILGVVVLIAAILEIRQTQCEPCQPYQTIPELLPLPKYFSVTREAGLQIFYNSLTIHCTGHIIAWKFVPPSTLINGLHLAVFRPKPDSFVDDIPRHFTIVGETRIDGLSIANTFQWTTIRLPDSIAVQPGDTIGLFYDNFRTKYDDVGVGIAKLNQPGDHFDAMGSFGPAQTLVLVSDATLLANKEVDAYSADVENRFGGVAAVLHNTGLNSTRCLVSLDVPDVKCSPLVERYTFQGPNCKLFHGCARTDDHRNYANNFPTKEQCERNCSRFLAPDQRSNVEAEIVRHLVDVGGSTTTTQELPVQDIEDRQRDPNWNERCTKMLGVEDHSDCIPTDRYHYNLYLNQCVPFSGCDLGANNNRNSFSSRQDCSANCVNADWRYTPPEYRPDTIARAG